MHRVVGDFRALDLDPGPASAFYRLLIPAIVLLPTWLLPGQRTKLNARSFAIIALGGLFFALDLAFYNTSICKPTRRTPRCWEITRRLLLGC
jgi:drug/metabolite transporter (DMT)-like permease